MQGWIKLHRQLLVSQVFDNEKLLRIWIWCLLKASHRQHVQVVGRQKVTLQAGQFVFGRKKAASELGYSESTVRDYMDLLQEMGNISIYPTNKFSLVTVTQWEFYQSEEEISDNKPDSKKTAKRQQKDTNKNDNNDKNDKKYKDTVYNLLNYWNEKGVVKHQETDTTLKAIENGLKKHSYEQIITAIDRYVTILNDTNYYYSHKWTLPKFLNQRNGVPEFLDEGQQWVNYSNRANKGSTKVFDDNYQYAEREAPASDFFSWMGDGANET